jgi:hypothetical protein
MSAETERAAIRKQWPAEFDDGVRWGLLQKFDGERELGGYPKEPECLVCRIQHRTF